MAGVWKKSYIHWVVGLVLVFRSFHVQFLWTSNDDTYSTPTSDNPKNCSLKLYIYPPTNKMLLNDPMYPSSKPDDLLLPDYFLEAEIFRTYFQHNVRNCTVSNPDDANAFLVPHASAAHFYNTKNYDPYAFLNYYRETLRPFLEHIRNDLPYFNGSLPMIGDIHVMTNNDAEHAQRLSSNHFFVSVFDNGPFCDVSNHALQEQVFADEIWKEVVAPMRQIGYFSQLHQTIPKIRQSSRQSKCFVQGADIALPMWNGRGKKGNTKDHDIHQAALTCYGDKPNAGTTISPQCSKWRSYLRQRASQVTKALFFRGAVTKGRQCSPRIRPYLKEYCQKNASDQCNFVDSQDHPTHNDSFAMTNAVFALCPAGFACWSARFYDTWNQMTIPVRLTDDMEEPFATEIPGGEEEYHKMMISVPAKDKVYRESRSLGSLDPFNITNALKHLADSASEWRQACSNNGNDAACLSHTLSVHLMTIAIYRHWFSWFDPKAKEGAFTLMEREMGRFVS